MKTITDEAVCDLPEGFYLSLLPRFRPGEEEIVDQLDISFLNNTPNAVHLEYRCTQNEQSLRIEGKKVMAFSLFFLHTVDLDLFNDHPRFTLLVTPGITNRRVIPIQFQPKIKIQKLFNYFATLERGGSIAPLTLKMTSPANNKSTLHETQISGSKRKVRRDPLDAPPTMPHPNRAALYEIDLHLEALAPDAKGLSNFEILSMQLEALEGAIDRAIHAHQQSLTIIHGVGKGKLKQEVHARLRSYREVNFFQQEWSPRYGNGATVVFFNQ